ncbi:MAG: hypothetical protein ACHQ53_06545 [Polyangiales bacterium]
MRLSLLLALSVTLVAMAAGCKLFSTTCKESDRSCLANPLLAVGVSSDCTRDADCKEGLYCVDRTCQTKGNTPTGKTCRLTAECGDKDYCGSQRLCKPAGAAVLDAVCQNTGNCIHGLVCEAPDLSQLGTVSLSTLAENTGECKQSGKKEEGEKCAKVTDCLAGLTCADVGKSGKVCVNPPASDTEITTLPALWDGVSCPDPKSGDPIQSFFEVPRAGTTPEFYSLPFPNDVRLKSGHVDMTGHPTPPASFGLPYIERYVSVANEDLDGFSTNPVVFFRFSQPYDFSTVDCKDTGLCSIRIVDITKASPEYDTKASLEWKTTKGPLSNYICPHWLALRRPAGSPLRPSTTYAAILTTDIRPEAGGTFARGKDFEAMLADSAPSGDDELKAAWDAYAPLRAWITDKGPNEATILNAAVFTTQDPEALVPKLRQQIQADAAPVLSQLTVCESESTMSPCEDSTGRGKCHAASAEMVEIHGRIKLPIFQQGTAPYKLPEDGGGFSLDATGAPMVQSHSDVCFAMSVPAAAAPAPGYPVLVFAHGTGGSFADELGSGGFAEFAATASVPSVLVAIDMPEHGDRRGTSTDSPEDLFYNFLNPRAARDNVLQGAADLMSVVRWAGQGGLSAAESPTGSAVRFDASHIALMGHSQGATHSSVMVSHEPKVTGVVLSGNGGHLTDSLLNKTSPVDIASVLPLGLLDPDSNFKLAGAGYNPALAILQMVFDRADPVNYARRILLEPTSEVPTGQHVFMTSGIGDTYAPDATQAAYLRAAQMTLVDPVLSQLGLPSAPAPLSANETIASTPRTIGARQYTPKNGVDGHFVGTDPSQDGRPDVEHFLDLLLAGKSPAIGQ